MLVYVNKIKTRIPQYIMNRWISIRQGEIIREIEAASANMWVSEGGAELHDVDADGHSWIYRCNLLSANIA